MDVLCNKANQFSSCGWCPHSKPHKTIKNCIESGDCTLKFDSKVDQVVNNVKCEKVKGS
jgi:hypothetical protein